MNKEDLSKEEIEALIKIFEEIKEILVLFQKLHQKIMKQQDK